jgi:hypothetical protein
MDAEQKAELERRWREMIEEASARVADWQQQHPKATLGEIEAAVYEQMHQLRAQMLEEVTKLSETSREGQQP